MADIEIGDLLDARTDKAGLLEARVSGYGSTKDDRRLVGATSNTKKPMDDSNDKTVFVQVVFMKLGEIDTIKETFTADVYVQARWREPKFDGKQKARETNPDAVQWSDHWNPKLFVHNAIGDLKESVSWTIDYDTTSWEAFVVERRRVKGTFVENLELFTFPFDTQDLTIKVASERPDDELNLDNDPVRLSTINVDMFVDEQEWRLYKEVDGQREQIDAVYDANTGESAKRTIISCRTHASRRPGFYITNILLIMFFICCMTFTSFSVDWIKRENRLQLTFILLLTTMAFKTAVGNSLPRISYLTTLDAYIMTSMTILILICVWHAIIPSIGVHWGNVVGNTSDKAVLIAFGSLYALAQITFVMTIGIPFVRRRWTYENKERVHKRKLEELKAKGPSSLLDIRKASLVAVPEK